VKTKRPVKTIVSVSDFHIHDDSRLQKIEAFAQEMDVLKPDVLILLGDVGDPWEVTWDKIMDTQSWDVLGELGLRRHRQKLDTIWINRNHDYSARRYYLPGVRLSARPRRIDGFLFMHGWEFDLIWNGFDIIWRIPGIAGAAFWLSATFPHFSIRLWAWLRVLLGLKKKTPSQQKARKEIDVWTRHLDLIHFRAMAYAEKRKVSLVIGHTHSPGICMQLLADDGDMSDSFSFLYIKDGKWELRTI